MKNELKENYSAFTSFRLVISLLTKGEYSIVKISKANDMNQALHSSKNSQ
jgi:hypothetical protein